MRRRSECGLRALHIRMTPAFAKKGPIWMHAGWSLPHLSEKVGQSGRTDRTSEPTAGQMAVHLEFTHSLSGCAGATAPAAAERSVEFTP